MCSYKLWIWMTIIYSIPLILILFLADIISLIGINAPHLIQYNLTTVKDNNILNSLHHLNNDGYYADNRNALDDVPKLGESLALRRVAYENQLEDKFNNDNSLDDNQLKGDQPNQLPDNKNNDQMKDGEDASTTTRQQATITDSTTSNAASEMSNTVSTTSSDMDILTKKANDLQNDDGSSDKGGDEPPEKDKESTVPETTTKKPSINEPDTGDKEDPKENPKEDSKEDPKKDEDNKPTVPEASRERSRSEILKHGWNEFMNGLHKNDKKILLNIFLFVKIGFRILSLITIPLLCIGNQTSRSTYIKPFKLVTLLQFVFCISITICYAIISTECDYYKNIKDWLPKHFEDPNSDTGEKMAKLYLLVTFADVFPVFCVISLLLISKRERQIIEKKDESSPEQWDIQLRPIGLPRIKNTNSEHISPLNLHFNQQPSNLNDNLPLTAGLISNEEISVQQPFSYTSSSNQSSSQVLPCYDNHGFNKN